MPLTDRQKRLYASAPRDEVSLPGLTLRHGAFVKDWHLTTALKPFEGEVDGALVTFVTHPFEVALPTIGADGKAEASLDIYNSGAEFVAEIMAASEDATAPIEMIYNAYFRGDPQSQIDPVRLQFAALGLTNEAASGKAASADFLNVAFPHGIYTRLLFRGLDR